MIVNPNQQAFDEAAAKQAAEVKLAADKKAADEAAAKAAEAAKPKPWYDDAGVKHDPSEHYMAGTVDTTSHPNTVSFDVTGLVGTVSPAPADEPSTVSFFVGMVRGHHPPQIASRHYKALLGPVLHIVTDGGTFSPVCVGDASGYNETFTPPGVIKFDLSSGVGSTGFGKSPTAYSGPMVGKVISATLTLTVAAQHGAMGNLFVDAAPK